MLDYPSLAYRVAAVEPCMSFPEARHTGFNMMYQVVATTTTNIAADMAGTVDMASIAGIADMAIIEVASLEVDRSGACLSQDVAP